MRIEERGSAFSLRWERIYYVFCIPVWKTNLHKLNDKAVHWQYKGKR